MFEKLHLEKKILLQEDEVFRQNFTKKVFISITKVSSQLLTALLQEFHLMGMKFVIDGQDSIIPL